MNIPLKSPVILMADDDGDDQLLVKEALLEAGVAHSMQCAKNGIELLDYLKHRGPHIDPMASPAPHLILLDLNMPLKDGREVLQEIKSDPALRRIPVVVFSTSKADTDIRQVYELGANSFVTKPALFGDLVKLMQRLSEYWFETVHLPETNVLHL